MEPATMALAAGVGGAALGGLAGAMGSKQRVQTILGHASAFENQLNKDVESQWKSFQDLLSGGPGKADVAAGYGAQVDLAKLLQQYAQGGFMPGQQDIATANSLTQSLFAPQQTQLNQQFADMGVQGQRAMAKIGRGAADPIFMNKLAQEQTRQQTMLNSQMGAYATQYAQQLPQMRLGYQQDYAGVMSGLASQALSNRQALLSMGSNLLGNERNFRLGSATKEMTTGGGFAGALQGALVGAGAGMSASKFLGGLSSPTTVGSTGISAGDELSYANATGRPY